VEPGKSLTIGGYAYLDGARFIKVSAAMDAIMARLQSTRAKTGLTIAFLCTPTDCHVIPKAAADAQRANFQAAPLWQKLLQSIGVLKPNALKPVVSADGKATFHLVDSITVQQGPNYILAKRLQHWRVVVARTAGVNVSSNIAPTTATKSVLSNWQFAAALMGLEVFKPMEIMYQETSNAVMAALLIHDVRNPRGPSQPTVALDNPLQRFAYEGFHGGNWRAAFYWNSMGMPAFFIGLVILNQGLASAILGGVVAVLGGLVLYPPHTWATWLL